MIIAFLCADSCYEHLFIFSRLQWKRYLNTSYGKFVNYPAEFYDVYKFETLGM
jgi:hypothetical protein